MKARAEYTDTFGGEANYAWVNRCTVEANTERGVVQKVKAEFGLTGVKCRRSSFGDEIWLYPQGQATVVFIYFDYYEDEDEDNSEETQMDMTREKFVDYIHDFYGPDSELYPMGATKEQISEGIDILLQRAKDDPEINVVFDSVDRERVRDILIEKFGLVFPVAPSPE